MRKEVYVVIGMGNISVRHRKNLKSLYPLSKVVGFSSSGRDIKTLPDYCDYVANSINEIIELRPKFVIIASPATYHLTHSEPFIKNNIPVLIEKPISSNLSDVNKILSLSRKYPTTIGVGYCLRFMESALEVKKLLKKGIIGKLQNVEVFAGQYLPNWRTKNYLDSVSVSKSLGGGVLLELSHEIDYIFWIFGQLQLVSSSLGNSKVLNLEVEEIADFSLIDGNGMVCRVHLDFLQDPPKRTCKITGEDGEISWNLLLNKVEVVTLKGKKTHYNDKKWDNNLMYIEMLKEFSLSIDSDFSSKIASVNEAYEVIKTIESIKKINKIGVS
jgi:predicted dehydrogenase